MTSKWVFVILTSLASKYKYSIIMNRQDKRDLPKRKIRVDTMNWIRFTDGNIYTICYERNELTWCFAKLHALGGSLSESPKPRDNSIKQQPKKKKPKTNKQTNKINKTKQNKQTNKKHTKKKTKENKAKQKKYRFIVDRSIELLKHFQTAFW